MSKESLGVRYFTATEIESMFGIAKGVITRWKSDKGLEPIDDEERPARYDIRDIAILYAEGRSGAIDGEKDLDLRYERARKEAAQADITEMQRDELARALVRITEVSDILQKDYVSLKAGVMRIKTLAPSLVCVDDPIFIEERLEEAANEILANLSSVDDE